MEQLLNNPLIIILVCFGLVVGIAIYFYKKSPTQGIDCKIIKKEEETFKVMSTSSKVTSRRVTINTVKGEILELTMINPVLFGQLSDGDFGKAIIKGKFIVRFIKSVM